MLEACLEQGQLLKKVIEAIKDLVTDANWDCNDSGIALQAMDSSHVALVALLLRSEGFNPYRCDRNLTLGINVQSMSKILKCAGNEDKITLSASDNGDSISFLFEGKNERVSEYELKLMDIDSEHLGIPETEYDSVISLPSSEFQRIIRDLNSMSESVNIAASKEGVKFSSEGELGTGSVTLKQNVAVDDDDDSTVITLTNPVSLTFSLKYLNHFAKATPLSSRVNLCMSGEVPLLVEYKIDEIGYLRFYLAPKIDDEQ